MNFAITWLFSKLGYMPKVTIQAGKLSDEFNFPIEKEIAKKPAKKPAKNTTNRKPAAKKTIVKKAK